MDAELPGEHFDGVFASNFLEHLYDQEAISQFLEKMHDSMAPGGRIAIMGPNYRYCSKEYWDCADHYVALTHVAIAEHLYAAGFEPRRSSPATCRTRSGASCPLRRGSPASTCARRSPGSCSASSSW